MSERQASPSTLLLARIRPPQISARGPVLFRETPGRNQAQREAQIVGREGRRRIAERHARCGGDVLHELRQERIEQMLEKHGEEEDRLDDDEACFFGLARSRSELTTPPWTSADAASSLPPAGTGRQETPTRRTTRRNFSRCVRPDCTRPP